MSDLNKGWDEWWARYLARVEAHHARQAREERESGMGALLDALDAQDAGVAVVEPQGDEDLVAWIDSLN